MVKKKDFWEDVYKGKKTKHKNIWPSENVVRFVNNFFKDKKIRLLEIGFGWGNNLSFFKKKKLNYFGIEKSRKAFLHCKKNHKNIYCCDFIDAKMKKNYFDCIIDRQCIQHNNIKKIELILKKSAYILKKNGIMFSEFVDINSYNFETETYSLKLNNLNKIFHRFKIIQTNYVTNYNLLKKKNEHSYWILILKKND